MYRIAAYITAYQDVDAVKKCITAIQNQSYPVEKIYIIDNSTIPLSSQINSHPKLIFDHHPENIGIAEGLKISIAWSIQENYDFLWTFDQDSEPIPNALFSLLTTYERLTSQNVNLGLIACLPIDKETEYELHGLLFDRYRFKMAHLSQRTKNYYECDVVITSGSLMVMSAVKTIDLFTTDLFIDGVDWDLCLKLKKQGYQIYIDQNAILHHHYGQSSSIHLPFLKRQFLISQYSSLRYYYICRNHTFIETRFASTQYYILKTVLRRLINLTIKIIKITFFESDQKLLKIWACLKGTYDGFIGRLGKTWS